MWRRIDKGREYVCWKEDGKQRRRIAHRWIWERANGPIPDGYEIHHRDGDALNNDPANLQLVTAAWHDDYHQRLREDHRITGGVEQRRCQRCEQYKPLDEFYARVAGTYGGYCKVCSREYLQEWRAKRREHHNSYMRAYRAAHKG